MQKRRIFTVLLAVSILVIWYNLRKAESDSLIHLSGVTMGTIPYSIKYVGDDESNFQAEIDSILISFNQSLSTYINDSEISEFNRKDTISFTSPFMFPVMAFSKEAYDKSGGAFDPTVGPLVDAWGFGMNKSSRIDSTKIDSLLKLVGFDKVQFSNKGAAKRNGLKLDFSASAKGYAIDVIADFLNDREIQKFMVEIGGEVTCKGRNQDGHIWKIGIEKPSMNQSRGELFATTFVNNKSIATSGNYRNYYEEDGRIISHTISPFTGYPSTHNLLSASIYASNCTLADAYATACMVLGVDKSIEMIEKHSEIDGFLIYSDDEGELRWYTSQGVSNQVEVLD
ncbi:MAG: FAD:protein FMN transferase [Reichenbachiella sp.]